MKTIIICTSKFGNPVTDYYKSLGECFASNDYKVIYVFDRLYTDYPKALANVEYHTWKNYRPTKLADFLFFYKLCSREKPQLVISNFGSTNVVSTVGWLLGVKNRVNYIHTTSVQLATDNTRGTFSSKFLKYRKKWVYSLNTHFFTNSNGNKEDAHRSYGIPKEKITVFPLLIPPSELPYLGFEQRDFCISIVGRLHPSKGHKQLLHLFKACVDKYPKLKLKIIGDGYLMEELVALTNELGLAERVVFLGKVPYSTIGALFSTSLIGISSSIDEAYGLVNIEALKEGTPIISTKTAGALDIIKDGQNGLFMSLEDQASLLKAVTAILENWAVFSNNALTDFEDNYSIQSIQNHFEKIRELTQ